MKDPRKSAKIAKVRSSIEAYANPQDSAYGDMHPRFGYPGGVNDVEELADYLRLLLEIGYLDPANRRFLSFEVRPVGDEDPDIVIANAKRTLNLAWAMPKSSSPTKPRCRVRCWKKCRQLDMSACSPLASTSWMWWRQKGWGSS